MECPSWRCGYPRGHAGGCEPVPPGPDPEPDYKEEFDALRSALQGEAERLRDEAARCRDEALKRRHKVTADLALGEGSAIDRRADRLQAILDSSASEQKGADR